MAEDKTLSAEMKAAADAVREATIARIKEFENETGKALKELTDAQTALKTQFETKGFADPETKEKVEKLWARLDQIDAKLTAPGSGSRVPEIKTISQRLFEHEDWTKWQKGSFVGSKAMRFGWDGIAMAGGDGFKAVNPFFPMEGKVTPILTSGLGISAPATNETIIAQQYPGLIQLQRRALRVRNLLRSLPATSSSVFWLKQNVVTNAASPQTEGSSKAESTITYASASAPIQTVAHFLRVSRQALDDAPWLRPDIDDTLMYGLKQVEENEILAGDGTGVHLSGLVTQATAYAGTYAVAADTFLDKLRHAILEARLSEFPVDGIILNPVDVHKIELIKEDVSAANTGRYIVGDPRTGEQALVIWGRPVVETTAITAGKFLVGSFGLGAILFDRMMAVLDVSLEDADNFTKNMVTIRAEERLALAVIRGAAFRYGSF